MASMILLYKRPLVYIQPSHHESRAVRRKHSQGVCTFSSLVSLLSWESERANLWEFLVRPIKQYMIWSTSVLLAPSLASNAASLVVHTPVRVASSLSFKVVAPEIPVQDMCFVMQTDSKALLLWTQHCSTCCTNPWYSWQQASLSYSKFQLPPRLAQVSLWGTLKGVTHSFAFLRPVFHLLITSCGWYTSTMQVFFLNLWLINSIIQLQLQKVEVHSGWFVRQYRGNFKPRSDKMVEVASPVGFLRTTTRSLRDMEASWRDMSL